MDRREALALFGLHEDANRSEIDEAYRTWAKKYKAADYADEPEYARRKLALLKEAYSIATGNAAPASERAAGDTRRSDRRRPERESKRELRRESGGRSEKKSGRSLECESGGRSEKKSGRSFGRDDGFDDERKSNRRSEHETEDRFGRIPERLSRHTTNDCDEHSGGLSKLKSLKSGYEATRKTFAQKLEDFNKEIAEYRAEDAAMEAEELLTDGEEQREYVEIAEPIGGSRAAGITSKSEKKKGLNQILSFLSIVVVLISLGTTIYNSDSSGGFFESEEESFYVSSVDQEINNTAEELFVVYDGVMPHDSVSEESYTGERLDDLLDQFTNVYTYGEYNSFDEWLDQLRAAYPGWLADSYELKEDAFSDVLLLFEFPYYGNYLGVENPGNGEPIKSLADYVQFLIDFRG